MPELLPTLHVMFGSCKRQLGCAYSGLPLRYYARPCRCNTNGCVSIYRLISMYNGSDSNTSAHTRFANTQMVYAARKRHKIRNGTRGHCSHCAYLMHSLRHHRRKARAATVINRAVIETWTLNSALRLPTFLPITTGNLANLSWSFGSLLRNVS